MVGPKKQDFKAKNKNIQRKMMVHQKVPKSYFQSRFTMSKKNRQMKAGQNNKYDIIKTSDQVWYKVSITQCH
jgi:hypothetical protein